MSPAESPVPAAAPGRPKDAAKHAAIIAAAWGLFRAHGFADVTMAAVAAAAGVSKATIYSHFGDKETLFVAVVRWFIQALLTEIGKAGGRDGTLAERLTAVGRSFLALICRPEVVAADRALVPTLAANPALAQLFYQAGPGQMRAALAEAIAAAAARGELQVSDATAAADDLFALCCGNLPRLLELGVITAVTEAEIAARVQHAIAVFLRAYAPAPAASTR